MTTKADIDAQVDELEQRVRHWADQIAHSHVTASHTMLDAADRIAADRARIKELEANAREWERVAEETALQGITDSRKFMARIAALEAALRGLLYELDNDDIGGLVEGQMEHARKLLEPNNAE